MADEATRPSATRSGPAAARSLLAMPMPVDPAPNEWPGVAPDGDATATASSAPSRLAQLERRQPRLPRLPPQETWNYGASSLAQKKKRQEDEASTAAAAAAAAPAPKPRARVQFSGGGSDSESDAEGGDGAMVDEESKSDDESTAAASTATDESMSSSAAPARRPRADPLYGPELDAADEAWLASQSHAPSGEASRSRGGQRTDAFLSCPACFAPLCVDCQRHATRPTQFRAMFVLDAVLVDRGRSVRPLAGTDEDPSMNYWAALCRVCKSHVGVMDADEVYHFNSVIESQA